MNKYLEIFISTEQFECASPAGLGLMVQRCYQESKGLPMVIIVSDDVATGPWATHDPDNYNRLDLRNEGNP
jgi:hypothetical protein